MAKLVLAFAVGIVFAVGMVWMFSGRPAAPAPAPVPAAAAQVAELARPAEVPAAAGAPPVQEVAAAPAAPSPATARAPKPKPLPQPPAARSETPVAAPPAPTTAAPPPEPERPRIANAETPAPAPDAPVVGVVIPAPAEPALAPATPRVPRNAVIPAGTTLTVRLVETLSSERQGPGYEFHATLDAPLIVDGLVLAERGTEQMGKVVAVEPAGRMKSRARLALELTSLSTSDGQRVDIRTETLEKMGDLEEKREVAKRAGIGAALGAAIGAIAGGGKGAAIGAAAGGGAGAGSVLVTRGKPAEFNSESRVTFRLKEPVTLTEKIQ